MVVEPVGKVLAVAAKWEAVDSAAVVRWPTSVR